MNLDFSIFFNSILAENLVLGGLLGVTPLVGSSSKSISEAFRVGVSLILMMILVALLSHRIENILQLWGLESLRWVFLFTLILILTQSLQLLLLRFTPSYYSKIGVHLPLVGTHTGLLSMAIVSSQSQETLPNVLLRSMGAGVGFTLVLILITSLRAEMELSNIPKALNATSLTLILAGILSLAFMVF